MHFPDQIGMNIKKNIEIFELPPPSWVVVHPLKVYKSLGALLLPSPTHPQPISPPRVSVRKSPPVRAFSKTKGEGKREKLIAEKCVRFVVFFKDSYGWNWLKPIFVACFWILQTIFYNKHQLNMTNLVQG